MRLTEPADPGAAPIRARERRTTFAIDLRVARSSRYGAWWRNLDEVLGGRSPASDQADNQPFTPIIETVRRLLLGGDIAGPGLIAVGWCIAITLVGYVGAARPYGRDRAR